MLSGLTHVMKLSFIWDLLSTILVISDVVSLVFSEIIEWVYVDASDDGAKYLLRLGSEIIISFVSNIGNNDGLSLVRSDGTSYGKRPGGGFGRELLSKRGTGDGILLGARLDWTVGKIEISLMRVLVGVPFGLSLIKYAESLLLIMLVWFKVSVKGKIVGLVLGDTNGAPLDRYFGLKWWFQSLERACKNTCIKQKIQLKWYLGLITWGFRWEITGYFIVTHFRKWNLGGIVKFLTVICNFLVCNLLIFFLSCQEFLLMCMYSMKI